MHDFQSMLLVALRLRYSMVPVSYVKHLRLVMDKTKRRAVSILLFLGGILVLMATWNLPENPLLQVR